MAYEIWRRIADSTTRSFEIEEAGCLQPGLLDHAHDEGDQVDDHSVDRRDEGDFQARAEDFRRNGRPAADGVEGLL